MSDLNADMLLRAYALGVFPMGESRDDPTLFWVDPQNRGILPLDDFHLSRRLARTVRQTPYKVTRDTAFRAVVKACAMPRAGSSDSWINARISELYGTLHDRGHAHSIECWQDSNLVGGLYGVSLGAAFFGESMFSTQTDASKIALTYLIARLKFGGYRLLDIQFFTEHLSQFGAAEIPRDKYRKLLATAVAMEADFKKLPDDLPGQDAAQLSTQTS